MTPIPIIDVSGLGAAEPSRRRAAAAQLGRACRDVGFFYVTGHGIDRAAVRGIFAAAHQLFALPAANKAALSITANRGYVALGAERLDEAAADQKEAFNIGLELPPDDPELLAGKPFRAVNRWPALPGWREEALRYFDCCMRLQAIIHRGFALDLGVSEDFFANKMDRPAAILRLLRYPAPAQAAAAGSAELGAGRHTDYGNLTILATDGVPGLQVRRRDGAWLDAPHVADAFVCNIGDCLMRWTNDVYVSTPHRVLRPARERTSVAFFADPNPDALVAALPSCVPPGTVPRYPPVTSAAYLQSRLDATYDQKAGG